MVTSCVNKIRRMKEEKINMFHLWHILAIVGVFVIGFFFGRWSVRTKYEAKLEELENRKESIEWAARHH